MSGSQQHRLDRIRSPRVQITYDVELGDAIQQKELPFVVGVCADLSGSPDEPLPKLSKRRFVEIDRDSFEDVMSRARPRVAFKIPDRLKGEGSGSLGVELRFHSMEDFEPHRIAEQVGPLKELLHLRRHLSDLLARIDGNDALSDALAAILEETRARGPRDPLPGEPIPPDDAI